jgi:hypothetical protein
LKTEESQEKQLFFKGDEKPIGQVLHTLHASSNFLYGIDSDGICYFVRCPTGQIVRIVDFTGDKYVIKTENARRM